MLKTFIILGVLIIIGFQILFWAYLAKLVTEENVVGAFIFYAGITLLTFWAGGYPSDKLNQIKR